MSLYDLGEPFVDMFFRKILDKFKVHYLPPNTLRGVDYLLTDGEFIFMELEDTVVEIYNAAAHMKRIYGIAQLYRAYGIIAIRLLSNLSSIRAPLAYFFQITNKYNVKRELWLLWNKHIIKIYEKETVPSPILSQISICVPIETKDGLLDPKLTRKLIDTLKDIVKRKLA